MHVPSSAGLLAISMGLFAAGCGGDHDGPPSASTSPSAASLCQGLSSMTVAASQIGLPTTGATVTSASFVAASATMPEYCRVTGVIASVDSSAQSIEFAAALPTSWNKKVFQLGGGGWDGSVVDVTGPNGIAALDAKTPLQRGYATFGSDSGHEANSSDASFLLNEEQLDNFVGDQLKKTHDTVMAIITARYGQVPAKTYFHGGSEGGRESMTVIQRFPTDYDGVITLYPVFNWFADFFKWQDVGRAMRLNGGVGWLSATKLALLHASELGACDTLDGAADGLISNVNACTFDPHVIRCPSGADEGDSCLSDAQVQTVTTIYGSSTLPYALANNWTLIPNYHAGTEWAAQLGTSPVFTYGGDFAGLGAIQGFADSLIRYGIMQDPNADTLSFDPANPGTYLARVQALSAKFDRTDPDISKFIAHGGKWILVHGLSDELPVETSTIAYYDELVSNFGQSALDQTLRFYTVPGFGHAHGSFDAAGGLTTIDALEAWAEQGQAPGNLVVTDTNAGANRTRPLCVYPTWPKYNGSGSLNSASSYTCAIN